MNDCIIRKANTQDIPDLLRLLTSILELHHKGRPDIFKTNSTKYSHDQLNTILNDPKTPVFVAIDRGKMIGYAFCIVKTIAQDRVLVSRKILYLDDLCVDEAFRGRGAGRKLMEAIQSHGEEIGADNLELNVWGFNRSAIEFYEHMGFSVQKCILERSIK